MSNWSLADSSRYFSIGTADYSSGGSVVADRAVNVKGSLTELTAATPFDTDLCWVHLHSHGTILSGSGTYNFALVDILAGPQNSEQVIIPNLPQRRGIQAGNILHSYYLPLSISQGTRLTARSQSSFGNQTTRVSMTLGANGLAPGSGYTKVVTYNINEATSRPTNIVTAGLGSKGAWVQVGVTTSVTRAFLVVRWGWNNSSTLASADLFYDIGIGPSGSERILIPDLHHTTIGANGACNPVLGPFPANLPVGTRIAARGQGSSGTVPGGIVVIGLA